MSRPSVRSPPFYGYRPANGGSREEERERNETGAVNFKARREEKEAEPTDRRPNSPRHDVTLFSPPVSAKESRMDIHELG